MFVDPTTCGLGGNVQINRTRLMHSLANAEREHWNEISPLWLDRVCHAPRGVRVYCHKIKKPRKRGTEHNRTDIRPRPSFRHFRVYIGCLVCNKLEEWRAFPAIRISGILYIYSTRNGKTPRGEWVVVV